MCLYPITLHKSVAGRDVEYSVPCGHCVECLKTRQNSYVVRCLEAFNKYHSICFITLTYDNQYLPHTDDGEVTLRREDLKNWKKDFRKKISNKDFAWILCGEYGPRTHRPHYHGLLFGLSKSDLRIIKRCWKYGFSVFKDIPSLSSGSHDDVLAVAQYVSKYVVKPEGLDVFSDTVERPRIMSSVGFGMPKDDKLFEHILALDEFKYNPFDAKTISQKIVNKVIDRYKYTYKGFAYRIPDYFTKKLLYEKNLKGNLTPNALRRIMSATLQFRHLQCCDSAVKDASGFFEGDWSKEALDSFISVQKVADSDKERRLSDSLRKVYKKSKF